MFLTSFKKAALWFLLAVLAVGAGLAGLPMTAGEQPAAREEIQPPTIPQPAAVPGEEAKTPKLVTLEGELKIHPKFLYRFYLVMLNGQTCALFGSDHATNPDSLARLTLPVRVRVRGVLGASQHAGGTPANLSPFPPGSFVFLDVHEVEVLKDDLRPQPEPGANPGGGVVPSASRQLRLPVSLDPARRERIVDVCFRSPRLQQHRPLRFSVSYPGVRNDPSSALDTTRCVDNGHSLLC